MEIYATRAKNPGPAVSGCRRLRVFNKSCTIQIMFQRKEITMRSMTLEQLRTASEAGGVSTVTLKGQGGAF
ncbi:MAG: hypothetical protein LBI59_10740, partial [Candidatus Accumulibacter sp.]|nr:hypothetical protein [Accumulibacter sp.]